MAGEIFAAFVRWGEHSMTSNVEPTEAQVAVDLVQRIGAGDVQAEAELVERYSRGLLYMLKRLCGRQDLAEDFHQETFRIVLERLRDRGLAEPERLVGFLRGTARNLWIADCRKKARRKTDDDLEQVQSAVDKSPSPLNSALHSEEARLVRQLISEMEPIRDRQLLYRFYIAEEDKDQICRDLELSHLHFNRVLYRARQRFRVQLERAAKKNDK